MGHPTDVGGYGCLVNVWLGGMCLKNTWICIKSARAEIFEHTGILIGVRGHGGSSNGTL
jgi:hypothetical protein